MKSLILITFATSFTMVTGCPTTRPRDRVEVAPGIYEDTLLSELSELQQEAVCIALRDSCFVATPGEEIFWCVNGMGGYCARAPATFVSDEVPDTCLSNLRLRIARNGQDCTATVGAYMQCDRDRWQQCQTAPGEWTLPSCVPVNCR